MIHLADKIYPGNAVVVSKIDQWYWASVFDNRYNEAVNTLTSSDYNRMKAWFEDDDKVPEFIATFRASQVDLSAKAKTGSIYRGVLCLILKAGARDFKTGKFPFEVSAKLEDDHIFPKAFGGSDQVLNRSLISSNESKGDKTPSVYFSAVETFNGPELFREIMTSHLIDANALEAIKLNSEAQFVEARKSTVRRTIAALVPSALDHGVD